MNNQALKRGVITEPYNSDILNQVNMVGNELITQQGLMAEGFNLVCRHIDQATRKDRRKAVKKMMATSADGRLAAITFFDDNTSVAEDFILNAGGPLNIFKMKILENETKKMFGIQFGNSNVWIIGEYEKLKGTYLYSLFVKTGIQFSINYSAAQIGQILFESLAKEILFTERTLTISNLGGWQNDEYVTSANFAFAKCPEFVDFPVMKKRIEAGKITDETVEAYGKAINRFANISDRILIVIYPFLSMVASLLHDEGVNFAFTLNVIPYERVKLSRICNLFQISNREYLAPVYANVSTKELSKICSSVKDEVLLVDVRSNEADTVYQRKKFDKNLEKTIESYLGTYELHDNIAPMGLVTISNSLYQGKGVCNLLVGNEMEMTGLKTDVMNSIFYEFILFVQDNISQMKNIISKHRQAIYEETKAFSIVSEMLKAFWEAKGYNFWAILGVKIHDSQYSKILEKHRFEMEDVIQTFTKAMRLEALKYRFVEKGHQQLDEKDVVYNSEWVWVPTKVFREVCERNGLKAHANGLLHRCKKEGILKTDSDGLTRKLTSGLQAHEYYQFKRSIFEMKGMAEFVKLGKA